MSVTILNPRLIDNGSGGFANWNNATDGVWNPIDESPDNHGAFGVNVGGANNRLIQNNVFTDYGTSTSHRIKVSVSFMTPGASISVLFGTTTASTITTTGITYVTGAAVANSNLIFNLTNAWAVIDYALMADVDISISPSLVSPVYNPFYFNVNSIHTSQPNFKYVFDIFTGTTVTGIPQSRIKLLPRPGGSANCIFSPARVLESYLSYDKNIQNIIAATNSLNHITPYTILFGEEYGLLSTGTTVYSGETSFSGFAFNGVLQYSQIPSWDYTQYDLTSSTSKFLTNQPRSGVYIKNTTDRSTASYMSHIVPGIDPISNTLVLTVYRNSGSTLVVNGTYSPGFNPGNIVHIPTGIWNINNAGLGTLINTNTDSKYDIFISASTGHISERLTYLIDTNCTKYDTVRIQFLNRLGGFDYFNFNLVSKKTVNITRNSFKKVLDYNYSVGDRSETILDIDGHNSYSVQSNWVNQDESNWLEELVTSTEVYVINSDGTSHPIIIDDNSVEIKKTINDKLLSYLFTYHSANKINGQRG